MVFLKDMKKHRSIVKIMNKEIVEAAIEFFAKLEHIFDYDNMAQDPPEKYLCWCMMHCRDVLLITDPDLLTVEQFNEVMKMGVEALTQKGLVSREFCGSQHKRMLEIGLTTLPVTDYVVKKLREKYPERYIER